MNRRDRPSFSSASQSPSPPPNPNPVYSRRDRGPFGTLIKYLKYQYCFTLTFEHVIVLGPEAIKRADAFGVYGNFALPTPANYIIRAELPRHRAIRRAGLSALKMLR